MANNYDYAYPIPKPFRVIDQLSYGNEELFSRYKEFGCFSCLKTFTVIPCKKEYCPDRSHPKHLIRFCARREKQVLQLKAYNTDPEGISFTCPWCKRVALIPTDYLVNGITLKLLQAVFYGEFVTFPLPGKLYLFGKMR